MPAHAHRRVYDLQLQPVSVTQIWARVCDGEKKRAFGCQERIYFTLSHKLHTHTLPDTESDLIFPVKLSLFLGLTLIYELWGGGKRGQDVDG